MAARKGTFAKASKPVPGRSQPTPRGVEAKKAPPDFAVPRSTAGRGGTTSTPLEYVRGLIRDVPDFPQPGILFKDITPLLADPQGFHIVLDAIAERFVGEHVDAVVGIESRGFIFGGALAARLNASFVPVRKPGKLPYAHRQGQLLARVRRERARDAPRLNARGRDACSSSTTCSRPAAPRPPRASWSTPGRLRAGLRLRDRADVARRPRAAIADADRLPRALRVSALEPCSANVVGSAGHKLEPRVRPVTTFTSDSSRIACR